MANERPLMRSATLTLGTLADLLMAPERYDLTTSLTLTDIQLRELLAAATSEQFNATAEEAGSMTHMLIGLYPAGLWGDVDVIAPVIRALLMEYPASVGRRVVDPLKGLPRTMKFTPRVAELIEALDEGIIRRKAIAFRATWLLDWREKKAAETPAAPISAERRAEMRAKLREVMPGMGWPGEAADGLEPGAAHSDDKTTPTPPASGVA
jgi:hypothetical protein